MIDIKCKQCGKDPIVVNLEGKCHCRLFDDGRPTYEELEAQNAELKEESEGYYRLKAELEFMDSHIFSPEKPDTKATKDCLTEDNIECDRIRRYCDLLDLEAQNAELKKAICINIREETCLLELWSEVAEKYGEDEVTDDRVIKAFCDIAKEAQK